MSTGIYTISKCGDFRRVIRHPNADYAAAHAKGWSHLQTKVASEDHPAIAWAIKQPRMQAQDGHAQAEINIPNWVV
jgi:hypothetical protein